jgi:hypothetical protein
MRHVEAAVYRTNVDKTVQFYGKVDAIRQRRQMPVSISALISVEGTNNFHQDRQPGAGLIVSRTLGDRVTVYAEPTWVGRTAASIGSTRGTTFVGLGGRLRVMQRTYVVGEISPRAGGYAPGTAEFGFGLEERVGGHLFQLNFTNTSATTLGQIARGGFPNTLFLGFNLARKFF